ncbi:hypothetical protein AYK59_02445 [Pseudomonas synxantha]|uniref:DUF3757 domain-containing protein n=2 Tax=Pseudomonas TaxID=286 RepID=A0ABR5MCZ3_9PSED|nr:hypothetical protein AYK59_02445 [Pseudomonas synxantha]KPG77100.1 hypothetical protein AEQ48_01860 [Pseudomonas libanensis]
MSHLHLLKTLQCLTAVGGLALMGNAYTAPLSCPDVSSIKAVSIHFSDGEQEWNGEQLIEDSSMVDGFKFSVAAIKQETDSETKLPYNYVICDYVGKGKNDYLRLSKRFTLSPVAKGSAWNEHEECKGNNVTDCTFELMNSKGPAKFTLPPQ